MLDSKSLLDKQLIEFNKTEGSDRSTKLAAVEKAFGQDEPILGFDEINQTLDDAEDKYTSQLLGSVWGQVDRWWQQISPDLDKLDEAKLKKQPLNLTNSIQVVLLNGWREIFSTGSKTGIAEINEITIQEKEKLPRGLFNASAFGYEASHPTSTVPITGGTPATDCLAKRDAANCNRLFVEFSHPRRRNNTDTRCLANTYSHSYITEFASRGLPDRSGIDKYVKRKPAFEVAYPPDQADLDVLDIEELKEALNLRTLVVAEDLSQNVSDRIDRIIKDSIQLHYVEGKEVQRLPKESRTKILKQINGVINRERQVQRSRGVAESELARNNIAIPNTDSFVNRAKMIASTELNAGYNLGRLQAYYRSGVKQVRWQAIGDNRTCKYCLSRNGRVLPLSTVLSMGQDSARSKSRSPKSGRFEYIIPAHPFCRCAWQVATQPEIKDKKRTVAPIMAPVPLAKTWGTISAAADLMSKIGTAGTALSTAKQIVEERQLIEQSEKKARNRAAIALGGALSLGALSLALWSWLNKSNSDKQSTSPIRQIESPTTMGRVAMGINAIASEEAVEKVVASTLTKTQGDLLAAKLKRERQLVDLPLTPIELTRGVNLADLGWSQNKQRKYQQFLTSGIDLKQTSNLELKIKFGLTNSDIDLIRGLQIRYQRTMVQLSPYEKLLPAAVISPLELAKYPWLGEIQDIRTLELKQLLDRGIPPEEAKQIYSRIYNQLRSSAGLAKVSKAERKVLRTINQVETVEQLKGILNLTRREQDTAQRLFDKLKTAQVNGKKGFSSLSEIRIFGVGNKTVARLLARAEKGSLKINLLPMEVDRALAEEILQERISGVGPKIAAAIYDALLETGTQFQDADEMYQRILPILQSSGIKIAEQNKLRKNLERLDFTYLPGLDRQPVLRSNNTAPPALPVGDRRGDVAIATPEVKNLVQIDINLAVDGITGLKLNFDRVYEAEIKNSPAGLTSRKTIGDRLIEAEKRVSRISEQNINKIRKVQKQEASDSVEYINTIIRDLETSVLGDRLTRSDRSKINENIRSVDLQIDRLNAIRDLSVAENNKLKDLENQLQRLKRQAIAIASRIDDNLVSSTNIERRQLINRSTELLTQLENLPDGSLDASYSKSEQIDLLKQIISDRLGNPVVEQIDRLIEELRSTDNKELKLLLEQQRTRLLSIRDRLL